VFSASLLSNAFASAPVGGDRNHENLTLIEMLKKQSFVEQEGCSGVVFTHFQNPFFSFKLLAIALV
jgi:hypothetical protein